MHFRFIPSSNVTLKLSRRRCNNRLSTHGHSCSMKRSGEKCQADAYKEMLNNSSESYFLVPVATTAAVAVIT